MTAFEIIAAVATGSLCVCADFVMGAAWNGIFRSQNKKDDQP